MSLSPWCSVPCIKLNKQEVTSDPANAWQVVFFMKPIITDNFAQSEQ